MSYRTYEGPRHTRAIRWWIVTLASLRLTFRNKIFWVVAALAVLPYLFAGITLLLQPMMQFNGGPFGQPDQHPQRALTFYQAFSNQGFFVFLAAITIGAGAIAADNRTNALLVYLSKPVTKGDYLLGKWMGLFLPLYTVVVVPALLLYVYCLASFTHEGFLHNEPTLIFRILLAAAVPAVLHSSLLIGFSAWAKRPAVAGVLYASLYILSNTVVGIAWIIRYREHPDQGQLFHCFSINGMIQGLAQNIYGVTLHNMAFVRSTMSIKQIADAPPPLWAVLALVIGLSIVGILAARARIRAVEVVKG